MTLLIDLKGAGMGLGIMCNTPSFISLKTKCNPITSKAYIFLFKDFNIIDLITNLNITIFTGIITTEYFKTQLYYIYAKQLGFTF